MKSICYTPNICKKPESKWSGTVTLRLPNFDEKFDFIEKETYGVSESGDIESSVHKNIRGIRNTVQFSEKMYVNIDLRNLVTGEMVTTFQGMKEEPDLHDTLIEIAGQILNGFKVGND